MTYPFPDKNPEYWAARAQERERCPLCFETMRETHQCKSLEKADTIEVWPPPMQVGEAIDFDRVTTTASPMARGLGLRARTPVTVLDAVEDWELNYLEGRVVDLIVESATSSEIDAQLASLYTAKVILDRLIDDVRREKGLPK